MARPTFTNGFENQSNKKSLTEQVNEICKGKGSMKSKKDALIKLGIKENEIRFILPIYCKSTTRKPSTPKEKKFVYTFGVEIECVMNRDRFVNAASNTHVPYHYEGYNHTDNREYFKFVTDGSLSRTNGREGDPIECVSPILEGAKNGFDKLQVCCNTLNEAGAYVNRSTGLHVHIGVSDITNEHYINVFKNYAKLQNVVDTFLAPSRRNNTYAKSLAGRTFVGCYNIHDVAELLSSRYYAVNPYSYGRHRTIEFRQHQGSTNFEKIEKWVNFCAKLVAYSKDNVFTDEVVSIDDIPFLNDEEKAYFKGRANHFNGTEA